MASPGLRHAFPHVTIARGSNIYGRPSEPYFSWFGSEGNECGWVCEPGQIEARRGWRFNTFVGLPAIYPIFTEHKHRRCHVPHGAK